MPVSVVIPTWRRLETIKKCLHMIRLCSPPPDEILIHIDAGDEKTEVWLKEASFPNVRWKKSRQSMGPGGGRNWLIKEARTEYLASFDDDSWPIDDDYFSRAVQLLDKYPKAAAITLNEIRPGKNQDKKDEGCKLSSSFQNGACLIRRSAFLEIPGFVPLKYGYGMEEADVALQLMDRGWDIIRCDSLRVYHDSYLTHQASKEINAAHITNTALLAFLRYPVIYWPLGIIQTLNRVRYALSQKRYNGIVKGLFDIGGACWKYRHYRKVVKAKTILRSRRLSRLERCKNIASDS